MKIYIVKENHTGSAQSARSFGTKRETDRHPVTFLQGLNNNYLIIVDLTLPLSLADK